jgi:hypothetical protein
MTDMSVLVKFANETPATATEFHEADRFEVDKGNLHLLKNGGSGILAVVAAGLWLSAEVRKSFTLLEIPLTNEERTELVQDGEVITTSKSGIHRIVLNEEGLRLTVE